MKLNIFNLFIVNNFLNILVMYYEVIDLLLLTPQDKLIIYARCFFIGIFYNPFIQWSTGWWGVLPHSHAGSSFCGRLPGVAYTRLFRKAPRKKKKTRYGYSKRIEN